MKSLLSLSTFKIASRPVGACFALLCLLAASPSAYAETVRDDFEVEEWNNNDGTVNWSGDWIEVDGDEPPPSPGDGNVRIRGSGELELDDRPNTDGEPSVAREANLAGASSATLRFDWEARNNLETSDSVVVEISANGGGSWTTLEDFTGIDDEDSGSRAYDITAYATATTQVRIRVNNGYGGGGERFRLEYIEIEYFVPLAGTNLSITQTDTPDPVNVANNMSYTLSIVSAGPDDATSVVVVDTLPAGVVFQSASATQGSCTESAGIVTCLLGDLASGSNATVNIVATAPFVTGTITNTATVSSAEVDPVPGDNTSVESTTVQNLNVNQLCYLVADSGGGNGGNDLFTRIDTADFNPATNETNIGAGTGTNSIEAIAFNSATGVVYAANANRLGVLNLTTGVFQPLPQTFGTGGGAFNNIPLDDADGLAYDATTGILYGVDARGGGATDVLFQINMSTGAHVPNAFGANVDYVPIPPVFGNHITDDIAIDPTTGIMYASVNSGGSSDRLIRIDKFTGATTDVSLITVPDIEGLGTDPSGQLWGTSGTQGILYEIDKLTGVGSNGRIINNGGDYESVDCFAFSPTITADLNVGKTVDDPAPAEGGTVNYTVTVTNAGPGPATVVQLVDLLPAGVTLVAATPNQGTYDPVSGDWFVGTIPVGSNATLALQALVDTGTGGSTITNTASVDFLSQNDPNAANDVASVDITPTGTASLTIVKAVTALTDPVNGSTDPKAIPGATMRYVILITNTGTGPVDADSLVITDPLPPNMALRVVDFDVSTPGPVQYIDGSPGSALTYSFVALNDTGDDLAFSDDGGVTFDYEPSADGNGVDTAVNAIRINPKGAFAASSGGDPSLQLAFKMVVQ
ncbi:MAG: DUF11 domain-containing protein [Woeseiaceae bacterium]